MKTILMLFIIMSGIISPVLALENIVIPAAEGIVENIDFVDIAGLTQDIPNVKQQVTVKVLTGQFKGTERITDNMLTGNPAYDIHLDKGDKVILHFEPVNESVITGDDVNIYIADVKRTDALLFLSIIFTLMLLIIGKYKGFYSLAATGSTIALIFYVLMPLILNGFNPITAGIIVSVIATVLTIYFVGGFNPKSTAAILGTTVSLLFAGLLAVLTVKITRLTGLAGEENIFLYAARPDLNFTGILAASVILAALGALMDTAVSIASTINEIHDTDNTLGIKDLFKSGMNVGRDVIGTMSNTLILVYLGSSLPLVLLANNIDLNKFFNLNQVATEISSALVGSIAILACVPITAIISAYMMKKHKEKITFNFNK